jgi:hypothetical protein
MCSVTWWSAVLTAAPEPLPMVPSCVGGGRGRGREW